jgi:uncharacterized protein (DUF1800 family)
MATRAQLAHLLRRATFGPRAEDVDAAERAGFDATLDTLLTPPAQDAGAARTPPPAVPESTDKATRRDQVRVATLWWLDRMVQADHQLPEKLTFFWHGHWATSVEKVKIASLMVDQWQTLRTNATGDFGVMLKAMLRDPALIVWLDGQKNTSKAPNENLARELMELFTLGIGNYGEADVREGARALTGWQIQDANAQNPDTKAQNPDTKAQNPDAKAQNPGTKAVLNPKRHDDKEKTILGQVGPFDADGLADILLAQPANAVFLASRMWYRYASGEPIPTGTRDRLAAAYRPARDLKALMRALLTDPEFAKTTGHLVKQPVEWAIGAMRQLGVRPGDLPDQQRKQLPAALDALGQVPFQPPSVGGWPAGTAWLTTSSVPVKLQIAQLLAARAAPDTIARLTAVPQAQRPDALARLLVVDGFTDRTQAVLRSAPEPRQLIALGLASPEYAVM